MKLILAAAIAAILMCSCTKDSAPGIQNGDTGSIEIEFDNVFAESDLELNTATYINAYGESFKITKLDYFISNIRLKTKEGIEYAVPKDSSYFLVKESDESTHKIKLHNVPAGDYTTFAFTVGVDSLKSVTPEAERHGVLDPAGQARDMYWSLNSGYIFLKMEGTSPASTSANNNISYHIGGYGGYDAPTLNNVRNVIVKAPFDMVASVRKDRSEAPAVHIFADAEKILNGTTKISIAAYPDVELSAISASIANNYAEMFNVDHIHND